MICTLYNAWALPLGALLLLHWSSTIVLMLIGLPTCPCTILLSDIFCILALCALHSTLPEWEVTLCADKGPWAVRVWAMLVWEILRGRWVARCLWLDLIGWGAFWGPVSLKDILLILGWWCDHLDCWLIFLRFIGCTAHSVGCVRPLLHSAGT